MDEVKLRGEVGDGRPTTNDPTHPGLTDRVVSLQEAVLLARIKMLLQDHRASNLDTRARAILDLILSLHR